MKVSNVEQMRAMDRRAMKSWGYPKRSSWRTPDGAAFEFLPGVRFSREAHRHHLRGREQRGDGLVVARHILAGGWDPRVFVVGDPPTAFRGAAKANLDICGRLPIEVKRLKEIGALRVAVVHADGIVDALFGTGLDARAERHPPRGDRTDQRERPSRC